MLEKGTNGLPPTELSEPDFLRIARIMRRETGVELPASKRPLVQARLLSRMRRLRIGDFRSYCEAVENTHDMSERMRMVSALTTNVTSYFRERHHFDYLRDHCAADFDKRLRAGDAVRIWSAGCSSGEEAYSVAMTMLDAIPNLGSMDFKILATDIDPDVLETAVRASYDASTARQVSESLRGRYFEPPEKDSGCCRVARSARNLIRFEKLNLIGEWEFDRHFDAIICRNVLIYFGDAEKSAVWDRMIECLRPNGVLMTGHSERLTGAVLGKMQPVATTTYRLSESTDPTPRSRRCH